MLVRTVLALPVLDVADERLASGVTRRFLVHERQGDGARIVALGRMVAVDLEHRELHLERLGERTEADCAGALP